MELIPGKERLFEKLFISPSNLDPSSSLIVSPHFLLVIMSEARSTPHSYQLEILAEIVEVFSSKPVNSLMLYRHDAAEMESETCILDSLVRWMWDCLKIVEHISVFATGVEHLIPYYETSLKNIATLTKMLSRDFHTDTLNPLRAKFAYRVIEMYLRPKRGLLGCPSSFFFSYGHSAISTATKIGRSLSNELSLMIVFCLLEPKKEAKICEIVTSNQKIVIRVGKFIGISNESLELEVVDHEAELVVGKWYRLDVNLTPYETTAFLNGEEILQEVSLLKRVKERRLLDYKFGMEAIALMTSLLILDKSLSPKSFSYDLYPQGLSNWRAIQFFKEKKSDGVLVSCLPFSTFQLRSQHYCFDMFNRSHSILGENTVIIEQLTPRSGLHVQGGYHVFLPLFYMARFYSPKECPNQIRQLLRIVAVLVDHYKDGRMGEKQEHFLMMMGNHLGAIPSQMDLASVELLAHIEARLSIPNKLQFIRHVLWGAHLSKIEDGSVISAYYEFILQKYTTEKSLATKAFGLMDILYWASRHLQDEPSSCCLPHFLTDSSVNDSTTIERAISLQHSRISAHFGQIERVAGVLVEGDGDVKSLMRMLLQKHSSCMYHCLLRITKRHLQKDCLGDHQDLLPFLIALADKCVDYSILADIVFLLLTITQSLPSLPDTLHYIVLLFDRLQQTHPTSPFRAITQKRRKQSADHASVFNVEESRERLVFMGTTLKRSWHTLNKLSTILLNYCGGVVSELQHNTQELASEGSLKLLYHFFQLAPSSLRLHILHKLERMARQSSNCLSEHLNLILLQTVEMERQESELYQKAIFIMGRLFSLLVADGIDLKEYLSMMLALAPLALPVLVQKCMIPHLSCLREVQLCQLLALGECIDCSTHARCELMHQIGVRLHFILINKFPQVFTAQNALEAIEQIKQLKIRCPVLEQEYDCSEHKCITFMFDIFLPKASAGIQIDTLLDANKGLELIELYFFAMLRCSHEGHERRKERAKEVVDVTIILIVHSLSRGESFENKSFLRMAIYFVTNSLFRQHLQEVLRLWTFIIQFVALYAREVASEEYSTLIFALKVREVHYCLVEIFSVFLRNSFDQELLPLRTIREMSPAAILDFLSSNEFERFVTLEGKIDTLMSFCRLANHDIIFASLQFSPKIFASCKFFERIEKAFDAENIAEEEARMKHLTDEEADIRKFEFAWHSIWNDLRLYHKPYGIWMAQKPQSAPFSFSDVKFKNFVFKHSLYASTSQTHPVMEAKLIEPWHVQREKRAEGKMETMRPIQSFRKKSDLLGNIKGVFKNLIKLKLSLQREDKTEYQVTWVRQGVKGRGRIIVSQNEELIFWYDSTKQEDTHMAFQKFSLPFNEEYVHTWRLETIVKVCRRRHLMSYQALEIVLQNSLSLLFSFENSGAIAFLAELSKARQKMISKYGEKLKLNRISFFAQNWNPPIGVDPAFTEQWRRRQVTTLHYLMVVNKAASRNMYDLSQYPVFPWVVQMLPEKQPTLRDLTRTMGGLGTQERKVYLQEKFAAKDPFNPVPPFFYGTHYSSPGVVFNYLIRVAPFTEYCKKLQGGKFDISDRLFASLLNCWRSAYSQVSDVRELTPEFYYLPECLLNLQSLNLGVTQSAERINDVELPPWAGGNPYYFITQQRQILQGEEVSASISSWIDLIFGYKQRGELAEANFNVYYYLTYEDYSHEKHSQDQIHKKSCEAQIVHFGQVPPQIFDRPHPVRQPNQNLFVELKKKQCFQLMNSPKEVVIGLEVTSKELVFVKRHTVEVLSTQKSPTVLTRTSKVSIQKCLTDKLFLLKGNAAHTVFLSRGYFIVYGYVDNTFRLYNRNSGTICHNQVLDSCIKAVLVNESENLILVGCRSGLLHVFQIDFGEMKVQKVHVEVFTAAVSHISEREGFFAISFGHYVGIYKIERSMWYLSGRPKAFVKFFRSFFNQIPVKAAYIVSSPLFALVLHDNAHIKTYSINGQFLKTHTCNAQYLQILVDRELNQLIMYLEEERLVCLSTPDLRSVSQMSVSGVSQCFGSTFLFDKQVWVVDCK